QGRVSYREVQLGAQHGTQRVLVGGLAGSERIVVNGTQRVRPGVQVKPDLVPITGGDDAAAATPVAGGLLRPRAAQG
ncbi:efflux transporter periplasmic adaptor subunit, partial [Burkholderia pseudomallei]